MEWWRGAGGQELMPRAGVDIITLSVPSEDNSKGLITSSSRSKGCPRQWFFQKEKKTSRRVLLKVQECLLHVRSDRGDCKSESIIKKP